MLLKLRDSLIAAKVSAERADDEKMTEENKETSISHGSECEIKSLSSHSVPWTLQTCAIFLRLTISCPSAKSSWFSKSYNLTMTQPCIAYICLGAQELILSEIKTFSNSS